MNTQIVPLAEPHFEALREVLDVVAREKRFLAMTQAPAREEAFAFFRDIVKNNHPHYVALLDEQVVGWCDILPTFGDARRHLGVLGIGLVRQARHQGIGARLMNATIAKAWARGLSRIELTVRTDNHNARALYERLGFQHEGIERGAFLIDGVYYDSHAMALLRENAANPSVSARPRATSIRECSVFSHVFVGVSNFERALAFYRALMPVLGVKERFCEMSRPWAGWQSHPEPRPLFLIGKPHDGHPHEVGNGQMVALLANNRTMVDQAYAVALANGGTSEGAPGVRPEYHANYYGAYFRDTEGNKLCVACHCVPG